MMTREMMIAALDSLGSDVFYTIDVEGDFDVLLQDFEGYDELWGEVYYLYENEEAVEAFCEMLESECSSREGDFYLCYHFDGFDVGLGYASFDI